MFSTSACENPNILKIIYFVSEIIKIAFIIIPIIAIIMLSLDFVKNVIANGDGIQEKNLKIFVRRVIMLVVVFLVPSLVSGTLDIVNNSNTFASDIIGSYTKCLDNTKKIDYYEKSFNNKVLKEEDERKEDLKRQLQGFQRGIKEREEYYKELRKLKSVPSKKSSDNDSNSDSDDGNSVGKTYKLTDAQVNGLAHVCVREQGNNVKGAAAEASLMANLTEEKGYSSVYDYVLHGTWFNGASSAMSNSAYQPSPKVLEKVKDVLVNGNRTLPLYIDEHDCWDCNSVNTCSGFRGDICKLDTNGKIISSLSGIKDRSNYKKDETKIYNAYGDSGEYYTFYTFPTNISDPFGYTPYYYKKIKGNR